MHKRWFALLSPLVLLTAGQLHAQDIVILRRPSGARNIRLEGTIVDLTGENLVIQIRGRDDKYPAERVVDIQTPRTEAQKAGEKAIAERKWNDAIALLQRAASEDRRTWMRRNILANLSLCYLNSGDIVSAVENFANVYASDPTTPLFAHIPLAWGAERADGNTLAQASRWLNDQNPLKRLMGASWLLNTQPENSVSVLQSLLNHSDGRIAQMAESQAWRARVVLATEAEVRRWQARLRQFPSDLRSGPSVVVGRALYRLEQFEDAATALMRAPIQQPQHVALSANALLAAGAALEKLQQPQAARRLYAELMANFPDTDAATLAKGRAATP